MEQVDKKSPLPCYYQVYMHLKSNIEGNKFANGQQLPSERLLAEQFNVNRFTVRRAVEKLIDEGFVYSIRRKGYFVKTDKEIRFICKNASYTQYMLDNNLQPRIEILGMETQEPAKELAELFDLDKRDLVWFIHVLRYNNSIPTTLSRMYLPYKRFSDLNLHFAKERSLYTVLNKYYGILPTRISSICEACFSDNYESKQLSVIGGIALLKVTSIAVDQNGVPVEQSVSKFRSDMMKIKIDLQNL